MATKYDFHKLIIGRSEVIAFVDTEAANVPAKVDTGAYRSAVHASNIAVNQYGELEFDLLGGHPIFGSLAHHMTTKDFRLVIVANSFGQEEERFEVKLRVKLGSKVFSASFTLADRSKKIFPILLGRTLLNHRFLVDSSVTHLNKTTLKERYGVVFPEDPDAAEEKPEL